MIFSPCNYQGIFQFRDELPYNLRQISQFHIPPVHAAFNGTNSINISWTKNMGNRTGWNETTGECLEI